MRRWIRAPRTAGAQPRDVLRRAITIVTLIAVLGLGPALVHAADGGDPPTPAAGDAATPVPVFDPSGQSPSDIVWPPYPAAPPAGFHWQHTGSPAVKLDPDTGQPRPGQLGRWILVRDGYSMPRMK